MELDDARKQKTLTAERQMSVARAMVIVFGTIAFFALPENLGNRTLAFSLMPFIWSYGAFVLVYKPYEKHPIFLASWFTYTSDCVFATLWIYATGGYDSPFHVIYYTSIIAVAYRFGLKTTLFTCTLYVIVYLLLVYFMGQIPGQEGRILVRTGFIYIIGFMAYMITRETLSQTEQKLKLKSLVEEVKMNEEKLTGLNQRLQLQNDLFNHAEQNADLGSYYLYLPSRKLEYSDNLFRLLGHEPGDFVPSIETYARFIHPDDREEFKRQTDELNRTHAMRDNMVQRVITKDGKLKYLRNTSKSNKVGDQTVLIGTLQDITNDINLSDALREKNTALEEINYELSSFNYVASHDLQEPVRKIITFSDLVKEKESALTETGLGYIDRIRAAAKRMQHLIEAFLKYSHINNAEVLFERIDLNEILEEVKATYAEELKETGGKIISVPLPVIQGLRIQIQQVFINLIGNAIKYRKLDTPPLISITVKEVPGLMANFPQAIGDAHYWRISVEDNGIGFEPQYSEKIFEVFLRLHTKDKYEGTGIGLAICRKILTSHKGFIRAESELGRGAIFHIYLPKGE